MNLANYRAQLAALFQRVFIRTAVVQVGGLIATTAVGIFLARELGAEQYGQFGLAVAFITLLCVPGELGLAKLVMREVGSASARGDAQTVANVTIWSTKTAVVISIALSTAVGVVLVARNRPDWVTADLAVLIGLPIVPLTAVTAIRVAVLMGANRIVLAQLPFQLIRPSVFALLALAVFTLAIPADPVTAMALNAVATAIALLTATVWLRRAVPDQPRYTRHGRGRKWLISSVWIAGIDAMVVFQAQTGILLLGLLATSSDAGIFRVAASAAVVISLPITLIEAIYTPRFARAFGSADRAELQRLASESVRASFITFSMSMVFALLFGQVIISQVFGAEYSSAYLPFLILCAARATNAVFGLGSGLLMMTGGERQFARALSIAVIGNLVAAALLIPIGGAVGAATGSLVYFCIWNVVAWRASRSTVGIRTSIWETRRSHHG